MNIQRLIQNATSTCAAFDVQCRRVLPRLTPCEPDLYSYWMLSPAYHFFMRFSIAITSVLLGCRGKQTISAGVSNIKRINQASLPGDALKEAV